MEEQPIISQQSPSPVLQDEVKSTEKHEIPPSGKNNNFIVVVALLVMIVVFGFLGWKYVFGEKLMSTFFPAAPTPTIAVQKPVTLTVTPDPTANWKTYKNEKYGYELKYPSEEIDVSKIEGYLILKNNNTPVMQAIVFNGIDNPQNLDLRNWVDQEQASQSAELINSGILLPDIKIPSFQEYMINNIKWALIPKYFGFVPSGYFYYVTVADKKIIFLGTLNLDFEKYKTRILQILSTFKFTEKKTANNYISQKLGISFSYSSSSASVIEKENKIYVGEKGKEEQGQWVQVFQKDKNESMEDAVKKQFLSGISPSDCFVIPGSRNGNNYPSTYKIVEISFPKDDSSETPWWAKNNKCPVDYSQSNGISYFLEDTNHPSKYVFFSIGQYPIDSEDKTKTWEKTIEFLD